MRQLRCLMFLNMQKTDFLRSPFFVSALPIFPARLQASIFGAGELNCRVRNGNGWTLTAISTDCYFNCSHTAKINMKFFFGDPCGNRTHVCGVRGRRLSRLTNGPLVRLHGFEPGTH